MAGKDEPLAIIRKELSIGTGDILYQTTDGRWWKEWDGHVRTGQEVRTKINGILK